MTGRHKHIIDPLNFALWLAESKQMVEDFFIGESPIAVSRIMGLIGAIDISHRIVLVKELENLASLVLLEAEKLNLKEGLLELFSKDSKPRRSTKFVKDGIAIELLTYLVDKCEKYLLNQTTSILKPGTSLDDAVAMLHRINQMCEPEDEAEVAVNLNNFCEFYVDKERWLVLKRGYYKHKHNTKADKKATTLNGDALAKLKKTQQALGLGNLSETVLELIKRSGINVGG